MNIHSFPVLIAAVATLFLGIFVYFKNKEKGVNKTFALFVMCMAFWNIDIFGIRMAPDDDWAEIWGKVFRIGLLFLPAAFLHFVISFIHPDQVVPQFHRKLLKVAYIFSCFFSILNWTPYFTGDAIRYEWGYSVQPGPGYPFFTASFFVFMLMGVVLLIKNYFHSDAYQKQRIRYFILALILSFILGVFNFLPMFGVGVYPFGNIAVLAGSFILAHTIIQHRLMDVSVFMAKALGYIFSLTILGVPGAVALIFLEKYFFRRIDPSFSVITVLMAMILGVILVNIKGRMDRAMRQIIVRDKYFYHQVLEEFSRHLVTIVDRERLLNMLAETIERSMGVKRISIFLYDPEKEVYDAALVLGLPEEILRRIFFKSGDSFIRWLREKKEAVLQAELERLSQNPEEEEALRKMKELQVELCLPLVFFHRLIGFINLGHKAGQQMYYREDLDLLNSLANQVAIAIENANLYENLKKSQAIMRRADRLASLGTLTASLAHEIRNPLVAIKTFTQLLPERIDDEEFRNYFLNVASGEVDRLSSLVNELLNFARPSTPHLTGEDINAVIDKIEFLLLPEARKKNITLASKFASNLPPVLMDVEQMKQVLLNVILNAIEAIEGTGEIWLETRLVNISRNGKAERFIQIEVRDTGKGIPRENLERIFDPFFSTRPNGSGLGLAISHQIVQEHGGFFDVESEVGKGTSFRIHIPLTK